MLHCLSADNRIICCFIPSIRTRINCVKFICEECNSEIGGKNYCKKCVDEVVNEKIEKIENLENNQSQSPMVFMNAGGGGSSSSSSSSSSAGAGGVRYVCTKSKVTAGILALLLGGIGAHKFYLGKIGIGILYLIFTWTFIPAIVGVIEGIMLLCSTDEAFNAKYGTPVAY